MSRHAVGSRSPIDRPRRRFRALVTRPIRNMIDAQLVRALVNDGNGGIVVARYGAVSGDSPCVAVATDMGQLWMPSSDMTMRPMFKIRGTWEPEESDFLGRHIAAGSTVVNVGANIGYTSLVLSRSVGGSGQVIALEPEPLNYKLLCINTARAGNVLPIHTAAGESTGSIRLNLSATNAGDHRTAPHEDALGGIDVPIVALDDLLADRSIAAIVSDTQGFDHRVIAGAAALISRCRPIITVEFWPDGIRNVGDDPADILRDYLALGYSKMIDVPSGEDLTGSTIDEIIATATSTMDHTTLALLP